MKKVSFDFDSTLSRSDVQEVVKDLINKGFEVWCVTSRYNKEQPPRYKQKGIWVENDNSDLFEICKEVGIKTEHIHFTNCKDKAEYFKGKNFLFHLDDDMYENRLIEQETNTIAIWCFGMNDWKEEVYNLINA